MGLCCDPMGKGEVMETLEVSDAEQAKLRDAIEVIRSHGMREARLILEGKGEAWIIRQTARVLNGGQGQNG